MLTRWRTLFGALFVLVMPRAFADWQLNMPIGVTEISREVYHLHMLIFGICALIAIAVFGTMIYSIIRHRKSNHPTPATFTHSIKAEIIWTVIPFAILIGMVIPAAEGLIKIEDTGNADMNIKVTGYQWKWQYEYLDEGIGFFSNITQEANEARRLDSGIDPYTVEHYLRDVDNPLVVPVGKKVRVLITAADVIHAWWVPDLGGKKDAIPGFVNEWWFRADEPGTYRGQCAELCGADHAFMPVVVEVLEEADYESWVAKAKVQFAETAVDYRDYTLEELLPEGEAKYNATCVACHQVNGQGLPPAFPPLAGAAIATSKDQLANHIDSVLHGRPGTAMQAFGAQLNDFELAAIITYERNAWGSDTGDVVQPAQIRDAR